MSAIRNNRLASANLLVLVLLVAHVVDHETNQPMRDMPATATPVALLGFLVIGVSTYLALRRHPLAPEAGIVAGLGTIAGFIAIHLTPSWSHAVSDPFWAFHPNALSWIVLGAVLAASAWLTLVAFRAREASGPTLSAPSHP